MLTRDRFANIGYEEISLNLASDEQAPQWSASDSIALRKAMPTENWTVTFSFDEPVSELESTADLQLTRKRSGDQTETSTQTINEDAIQDIAMSEDGKSLTVTLSLAGAFEDADEQDDWVLELRLAEEAFLVDFGGNAPDPALLAAQEFDNKPPRYVQTSTLFDGKAWLHGADHYVWTVQFSEALASGSLVVADFEAKYGSTALTLASVIQDSENPEQWQVSAMLPASLPDTGEDLRLMLAQARTLTDEAGNTADWAVPTAPLSEQEWDKTKLALVRFVADSDGIAIAGQTISFTLEFSAPIEETLESVDFQLNYGAIQTVTQDSGATENWIITVSLPENSASAGSGEVVLDLLRTRLTPQGETLQNVNNIQSATLDYDTQLPVLRSVSDSVSDSVIGLSGQDSLRFTLSFSETVESVDAQDFVVSREERGIPNSRFIVESALSSVSGSGSVWHAVVDIGELFEKTPLERNDWAIRLSFAETAIITDMAGNTLDLEAQTLLRSGSSGNFQLYDNAPPELVSIGDNISDTLSVWQPGGTRLTFSLQFNEETRAVDRSDFAIALLKGNAIAQDFPSSSVITGLNRVGTVWRVTVNQDAILETVGEMRSDWGIRLLFRHGARVEDNQGNTLEPEGTQSHVQYFANNKPILLAISDSVEESHIAWEEDESNPHTLVRFTLSFSTPVTGVDNSDFILARRDDNGVETRFGSTPSNSQLRDEALISVAPSSSEPKNWEIVLDATKFFADTPDQNDNWRVVLELSSADSDIQGEELALLTAPLSVRQALQFFDNKPPEYNSFRASLAEDSTAAGNSVLVFTYSFSEPVVEFSVDDFSITHKRAGGETVFPASMAQLSDALSFRVSGSRGLMTLTVSEYFKELAEADDWQITIALKDEASIEDRSGHGLADFSDTLDDRTATRSVDTAAPEFSSFAHSGATSWLGEGGRLTVSLRFTEEVTGVDETDFTLRRAANGEPVVEPETLNASERNAAILSAIKSEETPEEWILTLDLARVFSSVTQTRSDWELEILLGNAGTNIRDIAGNPIGSLSDALRSYVVTLRNDQPVLTGEATINL